MIEPRGIPEYLLDYCFPGDEFDQRLTVLVAIEKYTKMKKVVVVPNKGVDGKLRIEDGDRADQRMWRQRSGHHFEE